MNIDVVWHYLFSGSELAQRIVVVTRFGCDDAQIEMRKGKVGSSLMDCFQQRRRVSDLVHLNISIAEIEHRLRVLGIVRELGLKLLAQPLDIASASRADSRGRNAHLALWDLL